MTGPRTVRQALEELRAELAELTQPVQRKVWRDGGGTTTHTAPSLLDQLRDATSTSGESGGGGRGSRNPIPVDPDAMDLIKRIEAEAAKVHTAALQDTSLGIEEHLHTIGAMVGRWHDPSDIAWATGWLRHWRRAIEQQLDPDAHRWLDAPCPECGARMTTRKDGHGETVQVHALTVNARTGADCLACGTHWPPEQLDFLSRVIAGPTVTDPSERTDAHVETA